MGRTLSICSRIDFTSILAFYHTNKCPYSGQAPLMAYDGRAALLQIDEFDGTTCSALFGTPSILGAPAPRTGFALT